MSETIAIPSAGDVRKKLAETGLRERVATAMGGQPNHHPTGLAQFQVDPGVAGEVEVTAVLEELNSSGDWAARIIRVAGGARSIVVVERDDDKLAAWEAARVNDDEQRNGIRRQLVKNAAIILSVNNAMADMRQACTEVSRSNEALWAELVKLNKPDQR